MNNFIYLLSKFGVPVLFSFLIHYLEPNATWSMKTLLGISIFLVWTALENLHYIRKIDVEHKHETDLWSMEHDLDIILNNIRKHYREIVKDFYSKDDLFKDYFQRTFSELADVLKDAAEKKEVLVKDFHFQRTESLLSAFKEDESAILRYVWIVNKNESLFDEKWEHYSTQIEGGTKEGAIKEVRALVVLGDGVKKTDKVIQGLAGFYEFAGRHSYRLLDQGSYNNIKSDHRIELEYIDFGIYGTRYIYRTISYDTVTSGKFCKDKSVINRYTQFFDVVWNINSATTLPRSSLTKLTLADAFSLSW